jgi:phenylacetaldehyde dehydrogenase
LANHDLGARPNRGVLSTNGAMLIGGRRCSAVSGETFPVRNPATEELIAEVASGGAADVDAGVAAAAEAFRRWGRAPAAERAAVMLRIAAVLRDHLDDLVAVEVGQTGRPRRELTAQLARLPEWFEYFAALARTAEGTVPPFAGSYLNYTKRVPLGVVGMVTPWNHPLLILTKKVAPAMAAGNTMVVKPSELAPLTPLLLGEVFREAGLPDGVYNVVTGLGATAGAALAAHPGIRKLDLTGGTETGRRVAAMAAANLTRFAGELGGKAAMIMFDDVPVESAVSAALFGGFIATGQTCVQGARLLLHRSIHDEVVARLGERTRALRLGEPGDPETQVGPLISAAQRDVVERYVAIATGEGATLVAGGARPKGSPFQRGYWYLPTVFSGVRPDMRIAREEVFGPVISVMPFSDEAEAVALANDTEFGLAASVWTRDVGRAHRVAESIESGVVWVNDHHRIDPSSPWGGFGASGYGRENGIAAYEGYTDIRNIIVNLSDTPFDWYANDGAPKRYS